VDGDNQPVVEPADELVETVREIRERVRARHPRGAAPGGVALPDLLPLAHARDSAAAKVASIGVVNPRPPGLVNSIVQASKKFIARLLDWHVREQVEFNRAILVSLEAVLEALNENNRALARLASGLDETARATSQLKEQTTGLGDLREETRELKDIRTHWSAWRQEWEHKLSVNEVQFLRSVADLTAAFTHRTALMESNLREMARSQHADYLGVLDRSSLEIQRRLWADLERIRSEFERLIHTELRLIRQRASLPQAETPAAVSPAPPPVLSFDYARFAERFRGTEEYVRRRQAFYVPHFQGRGAVLDVGCGRGEFLELMKEAGIAARGIDISGESVSLCRQKGLDAETADLFSYLGGLADAGLDGIFCAQVVEHLPPGRLAEMVRLCASKLARGGLLAIETPDPRCVAIFATHFFLDPTHTRPVPPELLSFYMEESGLGQIEVHSLSPAAESMPSLAALPNDFRDAFFGGLDYAILGRKL
jgi:O-antigen chain-terminating methyltransferase